MEEWAEEAVEQLERITRDPFAGAARGTVRVLGVSMPEGTARYQECRLTLLAQAHGLETAVIETAVVFPRRRWPREGDMAPARISRTVPGAVEVEWEALTR